MNRLAKILFLALLVLAPACKSRTALTLNPGDIGSDQTMFENAQRYAGRDQEKARMLYKEIINLFPGGIYAQRARLGIADSYFKQKDSGSLLLAASEYQDYVNLYPYAPDAAYAKFQIGECYYRQMRKPGRDQSNTDQAIKAFESLIQLYPTSNEAEKGKERIEAARQNLARHFYQIGLANYRLRTYIGAIERFKQVINDYPEFTGNDALYYYTGLSYRGMGDIETARSFFQRVISGFPNSKFARRATRQLNRLPPVQAGQ